MMKKKISLFQFISQGDTAEEQLNSIKTACEAGVSWVQFRWKNKSFDEQKSVALEVKKICQHYETQWIINDHPQLVLETGADGVHLGAEDMPVTEARKLLGEEKIIGGTANTFDTIRQYALDGVDYVGVGPFRFTKTKKKLSPILGADGFQRIMKAVQQARITLPIVAIGGITMGDFEKILDTHVDGIAISSGVLNHENPQEVVEKFHQIKSLLNQKTTC